MFSERRIHKLLGRCVAELELDLSGLTVFTEAASGPYLYTPVMAALAGARRVYAFTRSSRYGSREAVRDQTLEAAAALGVSERLDVIFDRHTEYVAESDIFTNSGFVRPIDRPMIEAMKPTAVIPLMWETWEFRDSDLDWQACREKGILVLGTDEEKPPHAMYPYAAFVALKLLFEMGLEGYQTRVLLLGSRPSLGKPIYDYCVRLGMDMVWFSDHDPGARPYAGLAAHFEAEGQRYDALIVAEHNNPTPLLGEAGLLTPAQIARVNPALRIGVISGNVDAVELRQAGLDVFPETIQPSGLMSYQAADLGPLPVLHLYAAGLKVGQVMARARLAGMSPREAAAYTLEHAPAMDFEGERAWI